MLAHIFMLDVKPERISDFDTFDTHTRDALAHLKKRLADGYPVDIQVNTLTGVSRSPSKHFFYI
jgi:hypothetical protein